MATEKRLIDANALMAYINENHSYAGLPMAAHICTMEILTYAPTVDAVEVVRCKNCEHRYLNKHGEPCCEIWNHNRDTVVMDYDFCSYGERRINV